MKLKLISIHIKEFALAMPLATAMLKASLDKKNISHLNVELLDFNLSHEAKDIVEEIISSQTHFIGFSIYLWNFDLTLEVIRLLQSHKSFFSKLTIFAGGAEATANPNRLLKTNLFDFIITGEGELVIQEVMIKLLEQKKLSNIKGVYLKQKIHPSKNKNEFEKSKALVEVNTIQNLNNLPSPFLNNIIDFSKYKGILWELSRGCLFKCTFCFEGRGVAGTRRFDTNRLKKELLLFAENNVTQIWILDPTFNQDKKRAKKILQMIIEIAPQIHFTFEVRAEFLDLELAELFSQINCSLQIGLQSSNKKVLQNIQRTFHENKYTHNIQLLNQTGVVFGLDLIIGLPEDTLTIFKESLNYAIYLQPNHIDIFPLAILSGTQLEDDASKYFLHYQENSPYTIISSPSFPKIDINEAKRIANAVEIFYNKGTAVGWLFMILETLNILPSDFFVQFANYLESLKINSHNLENEILEIQINFTKLLFNRYNKQQLLLPMIDIITYHNYLTQSLKIENLKLPKLNYTIDQLMYIGDYNLEEFIEMF